MNRKQMKKIGVLAVFASLLLGCTHTTSRKDHSIYWQKNAAEYHALCIQAYNVAKSKVDLAIAAKSEKPLAIVADIDETVLNNLPYNELLIDSSQAFTQKSWAQWVNKKIATPIPGALEFFKYVDSLGIEIIYLSNRRVENYAATKENLIQVGFPFDEQTLMLLKDKDGNKESRRNQLSAFEVILYLGDNLADFDARFYKQPNNARIETVEELQEFFGNKFILFPNLIYGSWEMGFEE